MTEWKGPDGYWASDDAALIDVPRVHTWLSTLSYWAENRPRPTTERAMARSLNLGLYDVGGTQAGFCRWVTDGATFAWLCDVFVDPAHRGHGLGVFQHRATNLLEPMDGIAALRAKRQVCRHHQSPCLIQCA